MSEEVQVKISSIFFSANAWNDTKKPRKITVTYVIALHPWKVIISVELDSVGPGMLLSLLSTTTILCNQFC